MNLLGIDLATVPWPMFILLVFMVVAFIWYINVYLPAIEQLEESREQNKNILSQMNKQMIELTTTINDIQRNVYEHKTEESNINSILHDIETYAENLNDISTKFNEKELLADNKLENMRGKIESLTTIISEIKEQFSKKKFF